MVCMSYSLTLSLSHAFLLLAVHLSCGIHHSLFMDESSSTLSQEASKAVLSSCQSLHLYSESFSALK